MAMKQTWKVWFFPIMAGLLTLVVLIGFGPTFFWRSDARPALDPLFLWHGIALTSWFLTFVAQGLLIRGREPAFHEMLGGLSMMLVPFVLVTGWQAGLDALERGVGILGFPPETFFFMSATDMVGFAVLYGAALLFLSRIAVHKRLMLLATISLILPAAGRMGDMVGLGPLGVVIQLGFLVLLVVYDRQTLGRVHNATLWGGGLILAKLGGIVTVGLTPMWFAFVDGIRP